LLFGWMGVPDQNEFFQPTLTHGWIHTMTCPRELTLCDDRVYQQPARELQSLRHLEHLWQGVADYAPALPASSAELMLDTQGEFQINFADILVLCWDGERLTLSRRNRRTNEPEHRYWHEGALHHLQILCDRSSVEIFINHGQAVMSSRYFPTSDAMVRFSGSGRITLRHWLLATCVIE
jgi:beta-fructofuranosidase